MKTSGISRRETMTRAAILTLCALATFVFLISPSVRAEEGGGGHYSPGANASFIDALPSKPGAAVANYFSYYGGNASGGKQLYGGLVTASLDATAYADTLLALYRMPLTLLGGAYVVGVAVPYIWMEVKGKVRYTDPEGNTTTSSARDTANGFGDIALYPFMLGWTGLGGDLKSDVRLGIYIPTGEYRTGDLANAGKNYWTVEPTVTMSWLSSETGLELSAYAGVDFNTKNEDTEYRTGDQFHLDITVAEHLPFFGGLIGVGPNGFYYGQIDGDSGSGAVLGDSRGRAAGIGPVLSYVTKLRGNDVVAEVKWLPELDVKNRLEGDYIWFKLAMQF